MTRQHDLDLEERRSTQANELFYACELGLETAIRESGWQLLGFSVKYGGADVLLTLRLVVDGDRHISFVGGETLASALRKAWRLAKASKLKTREDQY